MSAVRPSLVRPGRFALSWQVCTWLGWAIVALSLVHARPADLRSVGEPLLMIVVIIALSELRPIVMTRLDGNPVSITLAFVFATMYLWGLYPAVLIFAGAVFARGAWRWLRGCGTSTPATCATAMASGRGARTAANAWSIATDTG